MICNVDDFNFSFSYLKDFHDRKLTTTYSQLPIAEAEDMNLVPKLAVCVPYNGLFFDIKTAGANGIGPDPENVNPK